jgi:hypothetical protein
MLTLGRLITSSIGRKVIIALGGMGLVVFVTIHMLGNVQLFCGQEVFNAYAAKLKAFPLLRKDLAVAQTMPNAKRAVPRVSASRPLRT